MRNTRNKAQLIRDQDHQIQKNAASLESSDRNVDINISNSDRKLSHRLGDAKNLSWIDFSTKYETISRQS